MMQFEVGFWKHSVISDYVITFAGGRYVITSGNGDLHIRAARPEDGIPRYSCLTLHALTQERKRSGPAVLTVTGKAIYILVKNYRELNKT